VESSSKRPVAAEKMRDLGGSGAVAHDLAEVERACAAAEGAFDGFRATRRGARAEFLECISAEILALGDGLILTAMRETSLPRARLEGERTRTTSQLRLFANVVREGRYLGLRVDKAQPDGQPTPFPDLRMQMVPLGPVAVFGASNFPLAFSTAGGDTASALAAGCPVVLKAHPAHPATSALVASAIEIARKSCGMPAGIFTHLTGAGNERGAALVQDPRIAAVAFTGSRSGGTALQRLAQARRVPIPVYAEMSSVNPVVLCPQALSKRGGALGAAFVQSLTLGVGQFCTNPGLVLAIEGVGLDAFLQATSQAISETAAAPMLTPGIYQAFTAGVDAFAAHAGLRPLGFTRSPTGEACAHASVFATDADIYLADPSLGQEIFGPTSLLVICKNEASLLKVLREAEGQLTATLQMDDDDMAFASRLLPILERKAGRILANGWPTGVEVTHAMVHGGPYPATTDSRTTSVGNLAIDRFLRPVCYQNFAPALLPHELRDDAPDKALHLVNGTLA
jgi:alpha-ketoglutaric semialdehyde dehydrogenase